VKILVKNDDKSQRVRIGIVTFPIQNSGICPLSNLLEIIFYYTQKIYLITGNEGFIFFKKDPRFFVDGIYHVTGKSTFSRILKYIWTQIKISYRLIIRTKNVDKWIFFFGGYGLLLPLVTAKLFKKTTVLYLPDAGVNYPEASKNDLFYFQKILLRLTYSLADKLIIYSPAIINEWNLKSYRNKILIAYNHIVDFSTFTITTPLSNRPFLIGYIGRFSEEKGVQNFVQALPAIIIDKQYLRVVIGGDGQLKKSIEFFLLADKLTTRVDLPGWIPHEDLPLYLNHLRLLILPSYTEGLPNIMLEAMACGTPVLATPVGAITDVIIDGKTGFIMENNSPECIAENVIRAMNAPNLEQITEDARRFVEENFMFEHGVAQWKEVLEVI
jgi:glycosyltransferase involved in cell wall biosynthesis